MHFLVQEGAQCRRKNKMFRFHGGIEHPPGPKNAEISTCFLRHVVSLRGVRMLCSGLWRHSKVFDSLGPNLQSKNYLGPNGRNGSWGTQNVHFFRQKFLQAVPLGANTFRWGEWSKKGRKGPQCVPKQVWTSNDTPILRFCILSEQKTWILPCKQMGVIL